MENVKVSEFLALSSEEKRAKIANWVLACGGSRKATASVKASLGLASDAYAAQRQARAFKGADKILDLLEQADEAKVAELLNEIV